ncbi:pirin family protein [Thiopseudomonas alkaliphila]|uniref:pirin family protein n=1 Tax=Thiopseudomonas alkaliphila TaxID=1697053 RepID=UPI00069F307B|nr:pirin [Thiopseudomonas alkaliphila]AKX57358.1 pirin [Thiopseudomonas alkaliphila]
MKHVTQQAIQCSREIESVVAGQATSDGAGVQLTRLLGQQLQRRLDPFLMLDAFGSDNPDDYIAGFPDHPHRGFETVTYMLHGKMLHRDSQGNEGLLQDGGMQWMSAARGVIHSEIPQQSAGLMQGFQLWVNLPAANKMDQPWYQDVNPEQIPAIETEQGVQVKILAGETHGVRGAIQRPVTEPLILDISLPANSEFSQALAAEMNAFVVPYQGELRLAGQRVSPRQLAILDNQPAADGVILRSAEQPTRVLLIAGKPLKEDIAQYGPFVMNSKEEIYQAVNDFQQGKLV